MRQIVFTTLLLAVLIPPVLVGVAAMAWWSSLNFRWIFVALGLAAIYALSAYLMFQQLPVVGMTGQVPDSGGVRQTLTAGLTKQSVLALAQLIVGSAVILWLLRRVL